MLLKISLVFVLLGITYLSLTPTETIVVGNDKISHFIAYSVLMTNIGLLTYSNRKKFVAGIIFAILFGVAIEIIQHFVPGRYMSALDIVANTIGVMIGVLLTILLHKIVPILKRMK